MITLRDNSYYLTKPNIQETRVPTLLFLTFYDAFHHLTKTYSDLNQIKPRIEATLKEKNWNMAPDALDATIQLLFHLTIDCRANLAKSLIHNQNLTCSTFETQYRQMIKGSVLPNPEHIFWDSKRFIDGFIISEINNWKQQNPDIAKLQPLIESPLPVNTALQQIIQHCIQIELDQEDSKVDDFFIDIAVRSLIEKNWLLKDMLKIKMGNLRPLIKQTRELMISEADLNKRKHRRLSNQSDVHNRDVKTSPPAPTPCKAPIHRPEPVPLVNTDQIISSFLDWCYEKRICFNRTDLLNIFRKNHSLLVNSSFENRFHQLVLEKTKSVIANEICCHYPHLQAIKPIILRKAHVEIDDFVQRQIQWHLSSLPGQSRIKIADDILAILQNHNLKPLCYFYTQKMIAERIKETKEQPI